ncbi:unnamed protein product [Orchesella dallaii]|uniref:Uncharacterized protein n=1 Tax=Orchesella dallaii TaxID=48710 RepID=A0ABP1R046_9HEXA
MGTASCRRLTKCTDLVRSELDNGFISNVALGEALLHMQFSHFKYEVDLFCRTNAAGSFSTVKRTLSVLGNTPFMLPKNDVALDCKLENGEVSDSISRETFNAKEQDEAFSYVRVPSLQSKTRVIDMECIPENPNSYKAIAHVLDIILEYLEREGNTRKYILVYMDGAPYSIA